MKCFIFKSRQGGPRKLDLKSLICEITLMLLTKSGLFLKFLKLEIFENWRLHQRNRHLRVSQLNPSFSKT